MPKILRTYWIQITSVFFGVLAVLAFTNVWHEKQVWPELIMAKHIAELQKHFDNIARTAGIVSFEHQKNHIDFLNVISFEGSELGSMNLANPKNWKGPYVQSNPTMQEKLYQVVKTRKGHFIVPGDGVTLANGKIIGKDIIFDESSNILAMMSNPQYLYVDGKVLAAPITLQY